MRQEATSPPLVKVDIPSRRSSTCRSQPGGWRRLPHPASRPALLRATLLRFLSTLTIHQLWPSSSTNAENSGIPPHAPETVLWPPCARVTGERRLRASLFEGPPGPPRPLQADL